MAGSYTYYTYYTYCTYYTYQVAAYMAGRIDTPHVYRTAARVYHGVEQACAWHGTSRHVHGTASCALSVQNALTRASKVLA